MEKIPRQFFKNEFKEEAGFYGDSHAVQGKFERLCKPLTTEEHRIQPIVEASPPWWSIMHTAWFYARNILMEMGEYIYA